MEREEERRLIRAAQSGDREAERQLLEQFSSLLWKFVKKLRGCRRCEQEDLYQVAAMAFLSGVRRFNLEIGVRLSTFLWQAIPNHLWLYVVTSTGVVHTPYSAQKAFPAEWEAAKGVKFAGTLASDRDSHGSIFVDNECVFSEVSRREEAETIHAAIGELPNTDRAVVLSRMDGETLQKIADRHGVTKTRIGQISARAIGRLKESLKTLAIQADSP